LNHINKAEMKNRIFLSFVLLAYVVILIKVMVLKDVPGLRFGHVVLHFGGTQTGDSNLIPFKTILPYLFGDGGIFIGWLNILGNIALLMPVGFLLPFLLKKINWKHIVLMATASGLLIEGAQLILRVGIFDIDDVILNGLGVVVGYWTYLLFEKIMQSSYKRVAVVGLSALSFAFVFALLVFIKENKLGLEPQLKDVRVKRSTSSQDNTKKGSNPCGKTNGTGGVKEIGLDRIVITKNNGQDEVVRFNQKTSFRNASGESNASIVKVGDRVTIVTGDDDIAIAILVCGVN
jgi:glycopeptide antibiotics resistance protein